MSWPAAGAAWAMAAGPAVAPTQDMSAMMGQYTPEQWAAWQQWNQWQQQYAQWQSQYGEKYAALQAMQGGLAPPLPVGAPNQPAPPPPDKPPPPPHENNQPLFNQSGAKVAPVPPVSNAMLQHNQGNHQAQDNSRGQPQRGWESDRGSGDWNRSAENWNSSRQQADWNTNNPRAPNNSWNTGNNSNQHNSDQKRNDWNKNVSEGRQHAPSQNQAKLAGEVNEEALRRLAEEERLFDVQFQKWEDEFEKWKQQNINHPDKKAYAEYEERFITCRAQLLERRQQMQQKRIKLMSKPTSVAQPVPPPQPQSAPKPNQLSKTTDMAEHYAQAAAQYAQVVPPQRLDTGHGVSSNTNFLSSSDQRKGIPGLDLVDEPRPADPPIIDITDDQPPKNKDDFSALSKGINNILGDEKILNMLSMVQQKIQPNNPNLTLTAQNNLQALGNNSFNQGQHFGPSNNAWQNQSMQRSPNFQNQNAGPMFNEKGNYNTSQYQNSGPGPKLPPQNISGPKGPGLPLQHNSSGPQNGPGGAPMMSHYPGPPQQPSNYGNQQFPPNNLPQGQNYPPNAPGRLDDTMQPPLNNYQQQHNYNMNRGPPGPGRMDFPPPDSREDADVGFGMRPPMRQNNNLNPEMGMRRNPADLQTRGFGPGDSQDRMTPNLGPQGPPQYGPNQGGGIPPLMGTPLSAPVDVNRAPNIIQPLPEPKVKWVEEPILEPFIIVDYEHKPLRMKVRDFIEPVQTFDYNHDSKDRDAKRDLPPLDRYSELDVYNQRSGTRVIDYQNRSANEAAEPIRRERDRDYGDRREEGGRRERYDERRRDDRRRDDERRRDEDRRRDDERRRDERARYERHRDRSPAERGRERGDWPRDRNRDRDRLHDTSTSSPRSIATNDKKSSPAPAPTQASVTTAQSNPVIMIDDLLESPGRDVRPDKIVIILRGLPGSGKSYLAKLIKEREIQNGGSAPRILSMDDYFIQEAEIEERDPATGKMVKKPSMKYVYDERQEDNYLNSLKRAYRRTITDHFFPFIIVDTNNDQIKNLSEFWNVGRQNGFQVYTCTLESEAQAAFKRNIHDRTLEDIQVIATRFANTPKNYVLLDATTLLQSANIQEVTMEDADDDVIMEDVIQLPESEESGPFTSKWEKMEDSNRLARLDGTSKPLRPSQLSLDEYLQLDDWQPRRSAQPGKKMVRWADLEERREQDKLRAIGFVVGQTDWRRMTDPTLGHAALAQTKYIERVNRRQ